MVWRRSLFDFQRVADGVWKGVQPKVIGHFKQLSLNKFFDPSTPSMRKGDDGEKNEGKKRGEMIWYHSTWYNSIWLYVTSFNLVLFKMVLVDNTSLAALGALAHRLQRHTACNTSPPALSKMADGVPK